MTRHRLLIALVAMIAALAVAAVIHLETSGSGNVATTATTTSATTSMLPPATLSPATLSPATVATTAAPTTLPATTLPAATLPVTTLPPPERALVPVVVSSGPSNGDRLAPGAFLLGSVGWTDIRPVNGSVALTQTTVFYVDGLRAAAELLAVDGGLAVTSIAPMVDAPPVAGLANAQLLFYFCGT